MLFKRYIERIVSQQEKTGNADGIVCLFFSIDEKRHLDFYFDVIRIKTLVESVNRRLTVSET